MRPTLTLLLALAASTTLTPATLAQNPLAKPKAPAARPFAGTFQGDDLRLELRWNDAQSNYRGKLTTGDTTLDVEATDAWYVNYVATLPASACVETLDFAFTDGDRGRMSREEILLHVVTHGGYHRGNVGQVLKSISVSPPRDLYTKFLHQSEPARRSA